ncbi:MAG: PAS domain S-box protein [Rhodospirillaceae bacterium]|nr:PAS domain S-box protein [Rhodospirillaceae bacterium]
MSLAKNHIGGRSWMPVGIRGRLVLWFILGAVGAVSTGVVVVYATGIQAIQETLGQTFCQIGSRTAEQFSDTFERQRRLVGDLATDSLTTEVALEQFVLYRRYSLEWRQARIKRVEQEWKASKSSAARMKTLHPQLSHRLSVLKGLEGPALLRLTVFDIYANALAASSPPAARVAEKASWYLAVIKRDKHFVYVDLDRERSEILFATPIWAGTDIVGFVTAEFDYADVEKELNAVRFGATGAVHAVDYAGAPLAGVARAFLVRAMGRRRPPQNPTSMAQFEADAYWIALEEAGAWPYWQRLACIVPVRPVNDLRSAFDLPPWNIVVTQSPDESYIALKTSLGSFLLVGVFGILVVGVGGAFIAWHITTPLKQLQNGVQQFARGDRGHRVDVSSADEIGALAAEFNRMAERVSASENELRAFAQAVADAADAIVLTDSDSRIYYVNPAFEKTTGYSAEDAIGETPGLTASPKTSRAVLDALRRAVEEGRSWRGELWNRRKNGDEYPVDLTMSPIHDDSGKIVSLLGVHRDISLARAYREQLEKEVEERSREIAETQGLRAMGQMASMIAHDLRNALSTIKMNLQILFRRQDAESEKTADWEHCRIGLDQVQYMEDIMRDMLAFARPDRLQQDWHDLDQIVEEAIVADSQRISAGDIDVQRHGGSDVPKAYCDRSKVLAVLRNLIGNALQAMPDGGMLRIDSTMIMGGDDPNVQVSVRDTGIGIQPDVLDRVLEPFFTTRAKGTGLGLAIVKRIVEQHGGAVEVDSYQGEGTVVRFTLPTLPTDKSPSDAPNSNS